MIKKTKRSLKNVLLLKNHKIKRKNTNKTFPNIPKQQNKRFFPKKEKV